MTVDLLKVLGFGFSAGVIATIAALVFAVRIFGKK
jgi:hypothetical protein